jgi:predicted SnoaL-like aldol condensation-catalyzing enzyme
MDVVPFGSEVGYSVHDVYSVTMTDEMPKTIAHLFAEMMNAHDPDRVDGFLAADYINHNPMVDDGREANRALWGRWFAAFPDTRVELEDVVTSGDTVVGRFTYRATHVGSLMGEPPTGRPVEMRSIDIWRVRDGRAVEHWDELNTLETFVQLGLAAAVPVRQDGA